jgi:hypothetical protein
LSKRREKTGLSNERFHPLGKPANGGGARNVLVLKSPQFLQGRETATAHNECGQVTYPLRQHPLSEQSGGAVSIPAILPDFKFRHTDFVPSQNLS